jgi:uncharacterized protein YydD (DUF2326 family)
VLHELSSDLPDFKTATFTAGLNIILAERTKRATSQDSRNAVGKTSLIRVLDFLLGSEARPAHILRRPELERGSFTLALDIGESVNKVTRSGANPGTVFIDSDIDPGFDPDAIFRLGISPESIRIKEWRTRLGRHLFGLAGRDGEPNYRSLISYYLRDVTSGAFLNATETHKKQTAIDNQPALTWLYGLDLGLISKARDLNDTQRSLDDLRKATRDPVLGMTIGRIQDLDASLTTLRIEQERMTRQLDEFQVVDRYADHRARADQLSREIRKLNDELVMTERQLEDIRSGIQQEEIDEPEFEYIQEMYREVGLVLPSSVRRRFDEVSDFHKSVVANRRRYLESEQTRLNQLISDDRKKLGSLDAQRADVMRLLTAGGALETYNQLQRELGELSGRLRELEERRATIDRWENANRHLQLKAAELEIQLSSDLDERARQLDSIGRLYSSFAYRIYGGQRPASLTIDSSRTGYRFYPTIGGDRSEGVRSIAIFCFDLTMAVTAKRLGHGPDFLVHDSHLYDSVEARQVASALTLASDVAHEEGLQYIVTLNSDVLESAHAEGFIGRYRESAHLTDAYDSGGLFGTRFNLYLLAVPTRQEGEWAGRRRARSFRITE